MKKLKKKKREIPITIALALKGFITFDGSSMNAVFISPEKYSTYLE